MKDLPWLTLEKARSRVSRAAGDSNKFTTNGKQRQAHRIDRESFSVWRLEQREKNLAVLD